MGACMHDAPGVLTVRDSGAGRCRLAVRASAFSSRAPVSDAGARAARSAGYSASSRIASSGSRPRSKTRPMAGSPCRAAAPARAGDRGADQVSRCRSAFGRDELAHRARADGDGSSAKLALAHAIGGSTDADAAVRLRALRRPVGVRQRLLARRRSFSAAVLRDLCASAPHRRMAGAWHQNVRRQGRYRDNA